MTLPAIIKHWFEAPVAVFGRGVSGDAAVKLIEQCGGEVVVYDERPEVGLPRFDRQAATTHACVVVSPGFAKDHPWMVAAREAGCELVSELDLASVLWRGQTIAVTGTNGKTTMVEFITHSLRAAGLKAHSVGNIGMPFSSLLLSDRGEDSWAVCEVSSFQAETMKHFRASSVIWSNFSEDHLDRYPGMEAYFDAKMQLVSVCYPKVFIAGKEVAHFAEQMDRDLPENTWLVSKPLSVLPDSGPFAMKPQRSNFQLVCALFRSLGFDPVTLLETAKTFRQSPHRFHRVGLINGVEFWNDSKATNFSSAEAALSQFEKPVLWIGCGKAKGGRIDLFGQRIASQVKAAFLNGETCAELEKSFQAAEVPASSYEDFADAVRAAFKSAEPGDIVLFSPGFASQPPFRNYAERGERFEAIVNEIKEDLLTTP